MKAKLIMQDIPEGRVKAPPAQPEGEGKEAATRGGRVLLYNSKRRSPARGEEETVGGK